MKIDDIWQMLGLPADESKNTTFNIREEMISTYVTLIFKFSGYYEYSLDAQIDTGCSISCARHNALPDEWWKPLEKPMHLMMASGQAEVVSHHANNVPVFIGGQLFTIKEVLAYPFLDADVIIGNAFLRGQKENLPFVQDETHITIGRVTIDTLEKPKLRLKFGFYPVKRTNDCGDSPCEQAFRVRAKRGEPREEWVSDLFSGNTSCSNWYDDLFPTRKQCRNENLWAMQLT
ncbi:hypothetical protein [Acinetobacter indicus]|uniref:hypothetical protein n=1 Tax=Acinetobacter indicus TaxID=756892 RepID=UPI0014448CDE|nr:hypothetical protein [Acinetobacter indicus]